MATKGKTSSMLTITMQSINVSCPCGGICENEQGSQLIDNTCMIATCPTCRERYIIPTNLFESGYKIKQTK